MFCVICSWLFGYVLFYLLCFVLLVLVCLFLFVCCCLGGFFFFCKGWVVVGLLGSNASPIFFNFLQVCGKEVSRAGGSEEVGDASWFKS